MFISLPTISRVFWHHSMRKYKRQLLYFCWYLYCAQTQIWIIYSCLHLIPNASYTAFWFCYFQIVMHNKIFGPALHIRDVGYFTCLFVFWWSKFCTNTATLATIMQYAKDSTLFKTFLFTYTDCGYKYNRSLENITGTISSPPSTTVSVPNKKSNQG